MSNPFSDGRAGAAAAACAPPPAPPRLPRRGAAAGAPLRAVLLLQLVRAVRRAVVVRMVRANVGRRELPEHRGVRVAGLHRVLPQLLPDAVRRWPVPLRLGLPHLRAGLLLCGRHGDVVRHLQRRHLLGLGRLLVHELPVGANLRRRRVELQHHVVRLQLLLHVHLVRFAERVRLVRTLVGDGLLPADFLLRVAARRRGYAQSVLELARELRRRAVCFGRNVPSLRAGLLLGRRHGHLLQRLRWRNLLGPRRLVVLDLRNGLLCCAGLSQLHHLPGRCLLPGGRIVANSLPRRHRLGRHRPGAGVDMRELPLVRLGDGQRRDQLQQSVGLLCVHVVRVVRCADVLRFLRPKPCQLILQADRGLHVGVLHSLLAYAVHSLLFERAVRLGIDFLRLVPREHLLAKWDDRVVPELPAELLLARPLRLLHDALLRCRQRRAGNRLRGLPAGDLLDRPRIHVVRSVPGKLLQRQRECTLHPVRHGPRLVRRVLSVRL